MPRHEKYHHRSNHRRQAGPRYTVLIDTSHSERSRRPNNSRSRTPDRHRMQSPDLLEAILQGHLSENLEVVNKNYAHLRNNFKVRPEHVSDPYDFTVLPVFTCNADVRQVIEESRELRLSTKNFNPSLPDARFKVMLAELKVHEADARLQAIRSELNNLS